MLAGTATAGRRSADQSDRDRRDGPHRVAHTHLGVHASPSGRTLGADCNIGSHCYIESGAILGGRVPVKNGNAIWSGVTLDDGVFVGLGVVLTNDLFPRSPRLGVSGSRYDAPSSWLVPTRAFRGGRLEISGDRGTCRECTALDASDPTGLRALDGETDPRAPDR